MMALIGTEPNETRANCDFLDFYCEHHGQKSTAKRERHSQKRRSSNGCLCKNVCCNALTYSQATWGTLSKWKSIFWLIFMHFQSRQTDVPTHYDRSSARLSCTRLCISRTLPVCTTRVYWRRASLFLMQRQRLSELRQESNLVKCWALKPLTWHLFSSLLGNYIYCIRFEDSFVQIFGRVSVSGSISLFSNCTHFSAISDFRDCSFEMLCLGWFDVTCLRWAEFFSY